MQLTAVCVAGAAQRGKVPIVVGGTGFYLRWFVHGKPQTPTSTPESAQRVFDMLAKVCGEPSAAHRQCLSDLAVHHVSSASAQAWHVPAI